ncbi:HpcH/HpaI aldolase/citrate lyase family protein [Rhodopila sp.]|uniref:HpcH/HpaI aldolase/citrate lyase family protein n=1 Tax=Rhodopila sp. TaxID=2480087 RepID=UPI003D131FC9
MTALRSLLFAPGNHARRVEKALGLAADGVILDLEDAVAVSEKAATRPVVTEVFGKPRAGRLYVRVNALTTEWCHGDLSAVVRAGLDGIILPKVEHGHELRAVDWLITNLERERGLPVGVVDLIPIIETALGIRNLTDICGAETRMRRIAFGAGDFTLDMGMAWTRTEAELLPHRAACVLHSRAAGLEPPLDTVWADLRDSDGFAASARHAAGLGFQGKMCIHPDQVAGANAAFTPDEATVAQAARVVAAFETAEAQGMASIQLDGQFIDYPIVQRARRVLAQGTA